MRGLGDGTPVSAGEAAALFAGLTAQPRRPLVLAVSGGPDSVALMGLYAQARGGLPEAVVATVDHGLNPASAAIAARVAAQAEAFGFAAHILRWTGEKPKTGVQEAARAARYALLADLAHDIGASALVTAHTLDDQAETVLMRLCRGSGLAGLAGMRDPAPLPGLSLRRPLLALPKARLVATCAAHGWPYVADPANVNPAYLRARLRALAPALAAEGLTPARLARLAARLARADAALEAQTDAALAACVKTAHPAGAPAYDAARMAEYPPEIVIRMLARLIMAGTGAHGPAAMRLERLESCSDAFLAAVARGADLRRTLGGAVLSLRDGRLIVTPEPPRRRPEPVKETIKPECDGAMLGNEAVRP